MSSIRDRAVAENRLDYASRPSARHRRKVLILLILAVAVFVAAFALYWWGEVALNYCQILYWQHLCLSYERPPTLVVFRMRPSSTSKSQDPGEWSTYGTAGFDDIKGIMADPWRKLDVRTPNADAVAFLHERRSSNGTRCLIAVELQLVRARIDSLVLRPVAIVTKPGLLVGPRLLKSSGGTEFAVGQPMAFDIYAGQADPSDASHFTIQFLLNGTHGQLDGWLQNDNSVIWKMTNH
jgi:hypothetical protein